MPTPHGGTARHARAIIVGALVAAVGLIGVGLGALGVARLAGTSGWGAQQDRALVTPGAAGSSASLGALSIGLVNIDTVLGYQHAAAAGTGILLSADGEVLTNNHVIDGATKIRVTVVATGKSYDATVVGTAPAKDIAVVHLAHASGLTPAHLGSSAGVRVGDAVVGVGNAGGTGRPTSAAGTVLALGQTVTATDDTGANAETLHNLIETSANLQPGDSGGPLFDAHDAVIGVDSVANVGNGRGWGRFSGNAEGYAIPIDDALAVARQIEAGVPSDGVTLGTPPVLGVSVSRGGPGSTSGVVVSAVTDGSPAASLGLRNGDVITAIGSTSVNSADELAAAITAHKVGDSVTVTWSRGGTSHSGPATLVAGPAN